MSANAATPQRHRRLVLLAGDLVLVAVTPAVQFVEAIVPQESSDRDSTRLVASANATDAVRVNGVQRGAVPIPLVDDRRRSVGDRCRRHDTQREDKTDRDGDASVDTVSVHPPGTTVKPSRDRRSGSCA
jgi:hypothetical protein